MNLTVENMNLPLVSIGLPVYNGERYLRQAIESLLSQDYGNFELIISDNASTDCTFEICQDYQAKNSRIRLYKNDSNIGPAKNFNKVFHLSLGKYFMWAAHDDFWDKSYISKCVAKLEANPTAVMCISDIQFIDEYGNHRDIEHIGMETIDTDIIERVHMLISRMGWFEIYGVIRPEYLCRTQLAQQKYGFDVILSMELLLLGEFVKVPEKIFYYRLSYQETTADEYMATIDPSQSVLSKPYTGMARELLHVVLNSNLEDSVKNRIQTELIKCLSWENVDWRNRIFCENASFIPSSINVLELEEFMKNLIVTANEVTTNNKSRKKITVLTLCHNIYPPTDGGQLRIFELYRNLSKWFDVDLITIGLPFQKESIIEFAPGFRQITIPRSLEHMLADQRLAQKTGFMMSDITFSLLYSLSPAYMARLERLVESADVIIASRPFQFPAIEEVRGNKPVLYDAHDVESVIKRKVVPQNEEGRKFWLNTIKVELDCCQGSELIMACTEEDKQQFVELYSIDPQKIIVISNGVSMEKIPYVSWKERVLQRELRKRDFTAVFIGSEHYPNIAAVQFLIKLAGEFPDIKFSIIGSVARAFQGTALPNNMEMTGRVEEDTKNRLLAAGDIAVNPMPYGSGMHLKMLEYFAAGLPVISTPIGARGLGAKNNYHLIIADFDQFAAAIVSIRNESHEKVSERVENARKLVADNFTWDKIAQRMTDAIQQKEILYSDLGAGSAKKNLGEIKMHSENPLPLVSIGLPVYNGERYLRGAIESLLSQDYSNIELIIADNASTDSTFTICQEYQAKDNRIRLYKNDSNIGAAKNFNKVFHLAYGKYFMWAAHDDLWDKSYISKCVAKLEENPNAVMCISEVQFIDEFGNKRDREHGERIDGRETVGMHVVERVHTLISHMFWYETYGVIRPEYLRRTHLAQERYGFDLILLMELVLLGEFIKVPEKLFMYRRHQEMTSKSQPEAFTGLARELLMVVLESDLDDSVKYKIQTKFIESLSFENKMWRAIILKENQSKLPPVIYGQEMKEVIGSLIFNC